MSRRFPKILLRIIRSLESSQRAFAGRTGVQPSTITKALTGTRPTEMMLRRLCDKTIYENLHIPVELACAHLKDELEQMDLLDDVLVLPITDQKEKSTDLQLDAALDGLRSRAISSALIREILIDLDAVTAIVSEKELRILEK